MTPEEVRGTRFTKSSFGRKGYDEHAVDAFVTRIEQTLLGTDRLTASDVRDVAFGKARQGQRGYREDDVDAFLDLVQLELRRRETPAAPSVAPPPEQSHKRWWQRG